MPEQHAPQVESLLVLARLAALLYCPCVLDFSAGELRLSTNTLMQACQLRKQALLCPILLSLLLLQSTLLAVTFMFGISLFSAEVNDGLYPSDRRFADQLLSSPKPFLFTFRSSLFGQRGLVDSKIKMSNRLISEASSWTCVSSLPPTPLHCSGPEY